MHPRKYYQALAFTLLLPASGSLIASTAPSNSTPLNPTSEAVNTALVRDAFAQWQEGRGNFFDLLAEDMVWTVAGSSPVSGIYRTREAFMENAVRPIHARLATAITPVVTQIVAQGDRVVVFWEGSAQAQDGSQYINSYAWQLVIAEGKITQATAYLDTWALAMLMD